MNKGSEIRRFMVNGSWLRLAPVKLASYTRGNCERIEVMVGFLG